MAEFKYTTTIEKFSHSDFENELEQTLSGYGAISGTEGGEWELTHFENLQSGAANYQVLLIFKK